MVRFYRTPEQYCINICQCRLKLYSSVNSRAVYILQKYSSHFGMPSSSVYPAELHLTVVLCSNHKSLLGGSTESSKASTNELHSSNDIRPVTKITTQRFGEGIVTATMYCSSSGSSLDAQRLDCIIGMTSGWMTNDWKDTGQTQDLSQSSSGGIVHLKT